jgi:ectoine hydroxylase
MRRREFISVIAGAAVWPPGARAEQPEEGHSTQHPRLHPVSSPQEQHPTFWEFMCDPIMTDLAADVVGPDVKFHHAKLNVKSERGTRGFKWHQDIPPPAWPRTDYSPVPIVIYLTGCDAEQGPLTFLRSSHLGPLHSMYDDSGAFVVHVRDEVEASIPADMVATATGGPGTTVLLNCRTIHGSVENRSTLCADTQRASPARHASVRATSGLPRWIQTSLAGSARRGEQG